MLLSTEDVKELLADRGRPIELVTIRHHARTHHIGTKVGRDWVFTEDDVERLLALPGPGRPPQGSGQ